LKGEFAGMDTITIEVKEVGEKRQLSFHGSLEKPQAAQPASPVAAGSDGGAPAAPSTSA
jgi:hypothetical protein